jgi:hypothetical protein
MISLSTGSFFEHSSSKRRGYGFGIVSIMGAVVLCLVTLFELLHTKAPQKVVPLAPVLPTRTHQVVLAVIDGLRYDLAINPERAPNVARRMREHVHGVMWAGRITMTSAAVFTIGTGQRSEMSHIITNLNASRSPYNDIFTNLKQSGKRSALAGDFVWEQCFGRFDQQITDEHGLAIHVDNSPEILAAAQQLATTQPRPSLLVAHFMAPDHQGHAYGTNSQQYLNHLKRFDAGFEHFLTSLDTDTTVIVISDHGAKDSGTHGTDTERERKTPLFAYGPGIRAHGNAGNMDQADLGPTLSVLLGIPSPTHARGTVLNSLLDLTPSQQAKVACNEALRVKQLALAEGEKQFLQQNQDIIQACQSPTPSSTQPAVDYVRSWDQWLDTQKEQAGKRGELWAILFLVLFGTTAVWLFAPNGTQISLLGWNVRILGPTLLMAALCVGLTYYVERTHAPWPNVIRGCLFGVSNLLLFVMLVASKRVFSWVERHPYLAATMLPMALALSYTANTQAQSFIVLVVLALIWGFRWLTLAPFRSWPKLAVVALVVGLVILFPYGTRQIAPLSGGYWTSQWRMTAINYAVTVGWLVSCFRFREPTVRYSELALACLLPGLGFVVRPWLPSSVALALLVITPWAALVAWRKKKYNLLVSLGFSSYLWVSRAHEVLAVLGSVMVLEVIALALSSCNRQQQLSPVPSLLVCTTLLFATTFVARCGLQLGLDFTGMDWGAGVLGDPDASQWRIGLSLCWKYVTVDALMLVVFIRNLPQNFRQPTMIAFTFVSFARACTLAWMLFACRSSYWTAYRTMSDLPHSLLISIVSGMGVVLLAYLGTPRLAASSSTSTLLEPVSDSSLT